MGDLDGKAAASKRKSARRADESDHTNKDQRGRCDGRSKRCG